MTPLLSSQTPAVRRRTQTRFRVKRQGQPILLLTSRTESSCRERTAARCGSWGLTSGATLPSGGVRLAADQTLSVGGGTSALSTVLPRLPLPDERLCDTDPTTANALGCANTPDAESLIEKENA